MRILKSRKDLQREATKLHKPSFKTDPELWLIDVE